MTKRNEKEVEVVEELSAEARKEKFNEILDKSKKALMYDGPVFGVGGLAYLYSKAQEVNDTTTRN